MTIKLETKGRRTYIVGDTYPIKGILKDCGAKWDGDARAWWLGSAAKAAEVLARVGGNDAPDTAPAERPQETLTDDSRIQGKAKYKGKTYILVWTGTTKKGEACKLAFSDGTRVFWADRAECEIVRSYRPNEYRGRTEYMTFGRLRSLQEKWKRMSDEDRDNERGASQAGGRCRCAQPLDEGDGECMKCGYFICN
jgi:hypothetical protein